MTTTGEIIEHMNSHCYVLQVAGKFNRSATITKVTTWKSQGLLQSSSHGDILSW